MSHKTKPRSPSPKPGAPGGRTSPDRLKIHQNGVDDSASAESIDTDQVDANQEAIEDERKWEEAFADTTEEDFARLLKWTDELAKEGTKPLDFTNK